MSHRLAKRIRKALGYHPGDEAGYIGLPRKSARNLLAGDADPSITIVLHPGCPRAAYRAIKRDTRRAGGGVLAAAAAISAYRVTGVQVLDTEPELRAAA